MFASVVLDLAFQY